MKRSRAIVLTSLVLVAVSCQSEPTTTPEGGPPCSDGCRGEGASRCNGDEVQSCERGATGCWEWASPRVCGSNRRCAAASGQCEAKPNPCAGIPTGGICLDAHTLKGCGVAAGSEPTPFTLTCPQGTECTRADGWADCASVGSCSAGAKRCVDASHLEECQAGTLVTTTCPVQCVDSAAGPMCGGAAATTKALTLHVKYEARFPKPDYSGLADTVTEIAGPAKLMVVSYSGDDTVDLQQLDSTGTTSIKVPVSPTSADVVAFFAAAPDDHGGWAYVIADPGFATAGEREVFTLGTPTFWSWSVATAALSDGKTVVIREADGSGALRAFDYVRYIYDQARSFEGAPGRSLVAWVGLQTLWSCGACLSSGAVTFADFRFASQMFLSGGSSPDYASDAVIAHEMGHWSMFSFGTFPGEANKHYLGKAYLPGMGWSEGWATWHSSAMRRSSRYYSINDGTMFWFDLGLRAYQGGIPWRLPRASDGLMQSIDENQVASMLYAISTHPSVGAQTMFRALSSQRMNATPFARGYTTHTWDLDAHGDATNIVDTGVSAPYLADFLDALVCGGVSRTVIDAATVPATQYPYPSSNPICQ